MSIQMNIELKEGQLVRVRNDRWLIGEVEVSSVRVGLEYSGFKFNPSPPPVNLACVDDDSTGELLEVFGDLVVDAERFDLMSVELVDDGGEG